METTRAQYFTEEDIVLILKESRGWQATVTINKSNGKERDLVGVVCQGTKGGWLVNEGMIDDTDFKQIPLGRVMKIKVNDIIFRPR